MLYKPITIFVFSNTSENLRLGINIVFIFLIFSVTAVFSRSYAGSLSKGEIKMILSYPVKRWELFCAKFVALFLALSLVYGAVFSLNIPLLALNPFEIAFYMSFMALLLQLIVVASFTTAVSLIIKNEIVSMLSSILLFFGLETMAGNSSSISANGRFDIIFNYFTRTPMTQQPSLEQLTMSIFLPLIISALLLIVSLFYFTRIMEID